MSHYINNLITRLDAHCDGSIDPCSDLRQEAIATIKQLRECAERAEIELDAKAFSLSPEMVQARNDQLNESLRTAHALLRTAAQALDDWIVTYAAEHCGEDQVRAARDRIRAGGGTIAYAAELRERISAVLGKCKERKHKIIL